MNNELIFAYVEEHCPDIDINRVKHVYEYLKGLLDVDNWPIPEYVIFCDKNGNVVPRNTNVG